MKNKQREQKPHFIRGEGVPNMPRIIDTLRENQFIEQDIVGEKWMMDADRIKSSLKNGEYKGLFIKFEFQLKIEEAELPVFLPEGGMTWLVQEELFKEVIQKKQAIKTLAWKTLTESLSINSSVNGDQAVNVGIDGIDAVEGVWEIIKRLRMLENQAERYSNMLRKNERALLRATKEEERNSGLFLESQEIENRLRSINREIEHFKQKCLERESRVNLNQILEQLDGIIQSTTQILSVSADTFIPSLYQRINIIDPQAAKKNLLIELLNAGKKQKEELSNKYLRASVVLLCILLTINSVTYLRTYGTPLAWEEFLKAFMGYGVFLACIEFTIISAAIISFLQFRAYAKIVEIYDAYIFVVNSDWSYKDDEHFHVDSNDQEGQKRLFDMRKENSQKIHALPEKTFSILCGSKLSDDLPQMKLIENLISLVKATKE